MHILSRLAVLTTILFMGHLASGQSGSLEDFTQSSPLTRPSDNLLLSTPINQALPAEQAFPLNVIVELPDHIVVDWEIGDGYYLYRKSLVIEETDAAAWLGQADLPKGEMINDEFFGDVEVYYDRLLVRIPLNQIPPDKLELLIQFQGCAEIGYCYPMQFRQVELEF